MEKLKAHHNKKNLWLIIAAVLNAVAAFMHLCCIYVGAPLFRFLGTEAMARMYEAGNYSHPVAVCLVLATILSVWSAYALSGAGVIPKLPLLRFVLVGIATVYLLRGISFPFIMPYFPENTMLFWYCSSAIVFTLGLIHLIGIKQVWTQL